MINLIILPIIRRMSAQKRKGPKNIKFIPEYMPIVAALAEIQEVIAKIFPPKFSSTDNKHKASSKPVIIDQTQNRGMPIDKLFFPTNIKKRKTIMSIINNAQKYCFIIEKLRCRSSSPASFFVAVASTLFWKYKFLNQPIVYTVVNHVIKN